MTDPSNRYMFLPFRRGEPYAVKVHHLLDEILNNSVVLGHVGNIYLQEMEFRKTKATSQHEFLVFHVRDVTDPSRRKNLARPYPPPPVEDVAQGGGAEQSVPAPGSTSGIKTKLTKQ
ncbi:hypothetical protein FRC10_006402 [Ceratobasidium sp. 414]|nr:hypothetical protein FRC10_006402 [Ceratobasidium sp. 414]